VKRLLREVAIGAAVGILAVVSLPVLLVYFVGLAIRGRP
jgi:hypothetical protein